MRENVIKKVDKEKIVVIIRGVEREKLIPLCEAMYEGGIRLVEVTYSANGSVSDTDTAKNIELLANYFEGKMLVGAGTVIKPEQVELTKSAGGLFIISPDTYTSVIEKTRELDLVSMPGALTPTEVQTAHRAGADYVKLFPVSNLGPDYVKAIAAPLSHIKFLAVGGINQRNMADYLKAGVKGFGIGTNIVDKKMIADSNYRGIKKLAEEYISALK